MLNRWIGIGRLTKDPELRNTPAGLATTSFTLAVDRQYKQDGQDNVDFIQIVTWRQTAEACAKYLSKGKLCAVEGRIQTRNYENNEGKRVYITEIIADNVRFLERSESQIDTNTPSSYSNANTQGNSQGNQRANDPFKDDGRPIDIDENDLPF